ncbi:3-oxoacyl-[acyl-carrier-protein] reductase FabG-like [Choristoneura fumiferana]|uniref:3-oxoacyl-[acyl-carrier-protein] reductase FabG-like n=1 Tax=Choristoneura fumiferana TaxID=7141 RepID=UPI003D15DAC2
MSLLGKIAIVTGAGSGIGAAISLLFASEGASVALVDLNETSLDYVAQQCVVHGKPPLSIKADVANEVEAKTIISKTIKYFGKLDILVNNAGIFKEALVTDPDLLQIFDSVMNTNLRSVVLLTNLAAPHLKATKGNIVNMCSVSSHWVGVKVASFCVSQAGVEHFTRCAALELAAFGVRVNSVHPALVRTKMLANALKAIDDKDKAWDEAKRSTALERLNEPAEIADVVLFLASHKARGITGSAFVCDSGFLLDGKLDEFR